jgi:dihydropteroate synthase
MSPQGTKISPKYKLRANGKALDLSTPAVMGILNVTPDSFFDGGTLSTNEELLERADKYIAEGASILDLGAMSTRPGSKEITEDEELRRLIPALKLLRGTYPNVFISVDTYRSVVALEAAEEGADIINDISAGTFDKEMMSVVAQTKLPYILMHIQGTPQTMQKDPHYKNVQKEVFAFLKSQVAKAKKAGIKQVVVDPGFGFGKTVAHNFTLLKHLEQLRKSKCPVLAGLSRKSIVNRTLNIKATDALNGTTVVNTIALLKGANILRVHDVKEAIEAVKLVQALG